MQAWAAAGPQFAMAAMGGERCGSQLVELSWVRSCGATRRTDKPLLRFLRRRLQARAREDRHALQAAREAEAVGFQAALEAEQQHTTTSHHPHHMDGAMGGYGYDNDDGGTKWGYPPHQQQQQYQQYHHHNPGQPSGTVFVSPLTPNITGGAHQQHSPEAPSPVAKRGAAPTARSAGANPRRGGHEEPFQEPHRNL